MCVCVLVLGAFIFPTYNVRHSLYACMMIYSSSLSKIKTFADALPYNIHFAPSYILRQAIFLARGYALSYIPSLLLVDSNRFGTRLLASALNAALSSQINAQCSSQPGRAHTSFAATRYVAASLPPRSRGERSIHATARDGA